MKRLISMAVILLFLTTISCVKKQTRGEILYKSYCESCHLADGSGLGELIPTINKGSFIEENRAQIACDIRYGILNGEDETYSMPANEELSEVEIVNILNFVRAKWHKQEKEFSLSEVKKSLDDCNQTVTFQSNN